mmetsp:Transcript_48025/g.84533  ORF Transcript_48025/g.84533 Transcript_48025/m.84533 type:complete len:105 (-) Transcript_48025:389-703(-)
MPCTPCLDTPGGDGAATARFACRGQAAVTAPEGKGPACTMPVLDAGELTPIPATSPWVDGGSTAGRSPGTESGVGGRRPPPGMPEMSMPKQWSSSRRTARLRFV